MKQLAAPKIDRLPPYDQSAEQGALGCVLLSVQECMEECFEFGAVADWFYDLRHQVLFGAMVELYREKRHFDFITLQTALKSAGNLDQVGGLAYISTLPDAVPSAAALGSYLEIIREKYQLRQTVNACTAAAGEAMAETFPPIEILSRLELELSRITQASAVKDSVGIGQLVQESITKMEQMLASEGITGLTTGLRDLDKLTAGLHDGQMIVLAARPSGGKSALGMQICEGLAVDHNTAAAFFSSEMPPCDLIMRAMGSRARVNIRSLVGGAMSDGDPAKLTAASRIISKSPLYVENSNGWTAQQIRSRARRLKAKHGIRLVVVDYLQLVQPTIESDNRQVDVSKISAEMKMMARELSLPVIVLCQMNRAIEKTRGRRPNKSDLRESGSIEQDADVIIFLQPMVEEDGPVTDVVEVKLIVDKQRNGPTDDVDLIFQKQYTRFEQAAKVGKDY